LARAHSTHLAILHGNRAVTLPDSYLNDIRIDNARNFAYLTDSGYGGIIVVNISTGEAWRKLDGDPSVLGDPSVPVIVHGFELKQPNGQPAIFNSRAVERRQYALLQGD
jgi:hypothetical protein